MDRWQTPHPKQLEKMKLSELKVLVCDRCVAGPCILANGYPIELNDDAECPWKHRNDLTIRARFTPADLQIIRKRKSKNPKEKDDKR